MKNEQSTHMSYKAEVRIRGALTQKVYGKSLDKVTQRGLALLRHHPAGFASLWPECVVLFEHVRQLSRRSAEWKEIGRIPYKD